LHHERDVARHHHPPAVDPRCLGKDQADEETEADRLFNHAHRLVLKWKHDLLAQPDDIPKIPRTTHTPGIRWITALEYLLRRRNRQGRSDRPLSSPWIPPAAPPPRSFSERITWSAFRSRADHLGDLSERLQTVRAAIGEHDPPDPLPRDRAEPAFDQRVSRKSFAMPQAD